jgi:hypothetical protein
MTTRLLRLSCMLLLMVLGACSTGSGRDRAPVGQLFSRTGQPALPMRWPAPATPTQAD